MFVRKNSACWQTADWQKTPAPECSHVQRSHAMLRSSCSDRALTMPCKARTQYLAAAVARTPEVLYGTSLIASLLTWFPPMLMISRSLVRGHYRYP